MLLDLVGGFTMSAVVRDFMNTQPVYLREGDPAEFALHPILNFHMTAVPVLDHEQRPVGVVSLRDLADPERRGHRMSSPAETISSEATISLAAVKFCDAEEQHLVVVDDAGRAVGMLSALDVIRAFLGVAKHPKAIEKLDEVGPNQPGS
jgi:CBS-domain-containing membrane protein